MHTDLGCRKLLCDNFLWLTAHFFGKRISQFPLDTTSPFWTGESSKASELHLMLFAKLKNIIELFLIWTYHRGACVPPTSPAPWGVSLLGARVWRKSDRGVRGRSPLGKHGGSVSRQAPKCAGFAITSTFPRSPKNATDGGPLEYNIYLLRQLAGTWYGDECQIYFQLVDFMFDFQSMRQQHTSKYS